jgi:SAM-dependent methyltransferase
LLHCLKPNNSSIAALPPSDRARKKYGIINMSLSDVQFPLALAADSKKRIIKGVLGGIANQLFAKRTRSLEDGEIGERLSALDRLLIAGLVRKHQRMGTMSRMMHLHNWLWAGPQALDFHKVAEGRFENWWLKHHVAIVEPLRDAISRQITPPTTLLEIGCGSGLVINDIATRIPELARCIGIDLSEPQMEHNKVRFDNKRLSFAAGDALSWISDNAQQNWVYITVAGVLEYFAPDKLAALLDAIAKRKPAVIAFIEPVSPDHDLQRMNDSLSISVSKHGFTVTWRQEQQVDGARFLLLCAVIS